MELPNDLSAELLEAVNVSACGVSLVDIHLRDQQLVFVNDMFCEMTGYSREDVLGRNCRLLQGQLRDQDGTSTIRQAIQQRSRVNVELLNFKKDGTPFWNSLYLAPSTNHRYFIGIQNDVTAKKEAEQRSEQLTRTLRSFAYYVSHDLRGPLRRLSLWASRLRAEVVGFSANGEKLTEQLTRSSQTLSNQIEALLQHANTGLADRTYEEVDLEAVARTAVQALAHDPNETRVVIEPLPRLVCDRARVVQLLQNLIGNAMTHAISGSVPDAQRGAAARTGKLHNELTQIIVSARRSDTEWIISVEDNGPGVSSEVESKIFDPFKSTCEESAGRGLGLYICKEVVEEHGGRIWTENVVPHGARFCFTLRPGAHSIVESHRA